VPDVDFVEEIRQTEQEADARIERARADAASRREACRKKAEAQVANAHRKAVALREERLAEAQEQYEKLLKGAGESDTSDALSLAEEELNRLAGFVAERITALLEHR
jgi:vacuolar-type H+-ATPase subunit H